MKTSLLGVSPDTIARHGVVSRAVVEEMARGVQRALHVDCAIATSGIAGPDGATPGKPGGYAGSCRGLRRKAHLCHTDGRLAAGAQHRSLYPFGTVADD